MDLKRALAVVERLFERGYLMLVEDDAGEVGVSMWDGKHQRDDNQERSNPWAL